MRRRIYCSALALLAATAVAGTAEAADPVTVTMSSPGSISDSAGDSWTKNTKWGEVGTYYDAGYDIHANYNGSDKYEKISGTVGAVLFDQDLPFGDMSVNVHAGQTSALKADFYLSAFGQDIIDVSNLSFVNTGKQGLSLTFVEAKYGVASVSGSGSWGDDGVDFSIDVSASVDASLTLAGVPLVFSAGGSGAVGMSVDASATGTTYSSSQSSINFSATPYTELALTAEAGVGVSWASVGVYGSLTLLEVSVPMVNSLTLTPTTSFPTTTSATMTYTTSGYLTLSSLGGEVGVYAKVGPLKYTYAVFDWDGVTWYDELIFTDSVPVVAGLLTTIDGGAAKASYTFADAAGTADQSTVKFYRSSSGSGTGTLVQSSQSKTYDLTEADSKKYIRNCVTPSNGINSGTVECGDWVYVGELLTFYTGSSFSGSGLSVAYTGEQSGHCYNISGVESGWNDEASSYKFQNVNCDTTVYMYKDSNCSGSVKTRTFPGGTPGEEVSSISSTFGSTWNNAITSFQIVYCDKVTASSVKVSYDGLKAEASYTLDSTSLFDTDESTFLWYTATSSSGSGQTQISTASSFTLSPSHAGKYVKMCVTPDNGTTTGSQVCTPWKDLPAVVFYWDWNYGGSSLTVPYTQSSSGTCFNLNDLKSTWANDVSSYVLHAPVAHSATITLYKDDDCSGSAVTTTASAGSSTSVDSLTSTFGSGWNDAVNSFKVSY
ncbi:MAG: hypothetical protein R3B70_08175 [Polyangiaceae bacterium]